MKFEIFPGLNVWGKFKNFTATLSSVEMAQKTNSLNSKKAVEQTQGTYSICVQFQSSQNIRPAGF